MCCWGIIVLALLSDHLIVFQSTENREKTAKDLCILSTGVLIKIFNVLHLKCV